MTFLHSTEVATNMALSPGDQPVAHTVGVAHEDHMKFESRFSQESN